MLKGTRTQPQPNRKSNIPAAKMKYEIEFVHSTFDESAILIDK